MCPVWEAFKYNELNPLYRVAKQLLLTLRYALAVLVNDLIDQTVLLGLLR